MTGTPAIPDVIAGRRDPQHRAARLLASRVHPDVLYRLADEHGGNVPLEVLVDLVLPLLPLVITEGSLRGEE